MLNRFTADLAEEIFASDWEQLLSERKNLSAWETLREMLVELSFPIREGMSSDPEYVLAKRKGALPETPFGPSPIDPDGIRVYLHPTAAGRIPVIETAHSDDFLLLLQCLGYRNEPCFIPPSMGAVMLDNYINWKRVCLRRAEFLTRTPEGNWDESFLEMRKQPQFYKDSILLLSGNYYSDIHPSLIGLTDAKWKNCSLLIRREHEVAHYLMKRYYGVSKNHVYDEIIADYLGITAAFGDYNPYHALLFLGLENPAAYRKGGRLENYFQDETFTGEELSYICDACRRMVQYISQCHLEYKNDFMRVFHKVYQKNWLEIASSNQVSYI